MPITDTVSLGLRRSSSLLDKHKDLKLMGKTDELPLKGVLLFLGFFGAVPFTWKRPHYPSLHPTKSTLALAILALAIIIFSSYKMFMFYGHRLLTEEFPLDEKMIHIQDIVICLASPTLAVALWSDIQALRRGINIWFCLNMLYFKIRNRKFKPAWHTFEIIIAPISVVYATATFLAAKFGFPSFKVSYIFGPCCVYAMTMLCLMGTLWVGHFTSLARMAEEINRELLSDIKRNALTTENLVCYHKIWLQMRALTNAFGTFNSIVVVVVGGVGTLINCVYNSIFYFMTERYLRSLAPLVVAITCVAAMTLMIKASHSAIDQIKVLHGSILAKHKVAPFQETLQRQVMYMYLVQRMSCPSPTFGNFVSVNNSLLISVFGTVAMHLVVLTQINQSN